MCLPKKGNNVYNARQVITPTAITELMVRILNFLSAERKFATKEVIKIPSKKYAPDNLKRIAMQIKMMEVIRSNFLLDFRKYMKKIEDI